MGDVIIGVGLRIFSRGHWAQSANPTRQFLVQVLEETRLPCEYLEFLIGHLAFLVGELWPKKQNLVKKQNSQVQDCKLWGRLQAIIPCSVRLLESNLLVYKPVKITIVSTAKISLLCRSFIVQYNPRLVLVYSDKNNIWATTSLILTLAHSTRPIN